jgi:DNA-binding response OmpR family regulator
MKPDASVISCIVSEDRQVVFEELRRHVRHHETKRWRGRLSLRQLLLRDPIELGVVEAKILRFLASRPYHPFSRRKIAEAVTSERNPVGEDDVDRFVRSLRQQLGFYSDYVQSVRFLGYRFKA